MQGDAKLVLMGVEPTYPSEKYGYIIPETKDEISKVQTFKGKNRMQRLQQSTLSRGPYGMVAIFAYQLKYVLQKSA